ncbi:hypothetical protein OF83DRAFT_1177089 [Amylostereum chailletii]|nr:hypothetical protein OF83DRAFT_1177089 [Amylostereum chailletii]
MMEGKLHGHEDFSADGFGEGDRDEESNDAEEPALTNQLSAMHMDPPGWATRRRHNALKPIYSLFPEILSAVFYFLAFDVDELPLVRSSKDVTVLDSSGRSQVQPHPGNLRWIQVTHVCHLWREVALADASLWKNIELGMGEEWAAEMLARAKDTLLTYRLPPNTFDANRDDCFTILDERIDSIREIDIHDSIDEFVSLLYSMRKPARVLRRFSCHLYRKFGLVRLPSGLFSNFAPQLRKVELHSCLPHWPSFVFPSIEELCLTIHEGFLADSHPPMRFVHPLSSEFYKCLAGMPNLHKLSLLGCLPNPNKSDSESSDDHVAFPNLLEFNVGGLPAGCADVLKRTSFPHTTFVILVFFLPDDNSISLLRDARMSLQALSRRISERHDGHSPRVRMLYMDTHASLSVPFLATIQTWETLPETPWFELDNSPPANLQAMFRSNEPHDASVFRTFLEDAVRTLPIANVETLILSVQSGGEEWDTASAEAFVRGLPASVDHLVLAGGIDPCLLRVLLTATDPSDGIPHLRNLKVVTFRARLEPEALAFESTFRHRLEESGAEDSILVSVLEKQASGVPLEKINVMSSYPCTRAWVQRLEEVVSVARDE